MLSRKHFAIPYALFLIAFIVCPLVLIVIYSITTPDFKLTLDNYKVVFTIDNINTLVNSIFISLISTIICLLIGYPLAYLLADRKVNKSTVLIYFFVMPMWINFVLRTAATRDLLFSIGLSGGDHPYIATMIGMVYNYLPFTILPLYSQMLKMDKSLFEASYDLGANKVQTFFKTQIPLTMPGIISGAMMVFMPTMSSFVISDVMGERKIQLIGNTIQFNFDQMRWHEGSFIALVMLIIIGISMLLTRNVKTEPNARGGLW